MRSTFPGENFNVIFENRQEMLTLICTPVTLQEFISPLSLPDIGVI